MARPIEYKRTWCEYLTPCPYGMVDGGDNEILVGSYECEVECPFYKGSTDCAIDGTVQCSYEPIFK